MATNTQVTKWLDIALKQRERSAKVFEEEYGPENTTMIRNEITLLKDVIDMFKTSKTPLIDKLKSSK